MLRETGRSLRRTRRPRLQRRGDPAPAPLSYAQQRLWFLDRVGEGSQEYHLTTALRLRGPLAVEALQQALTRIVARHESLRTCFALVDDEPRQMVAAAERVAMPVLDLAVLPEAVQAAAVQEALQAERTTPFDLERGPILRVQLLRLGPTDHILLRTIHHIASDGWSEGVFTHELSTLYAAARAGRADPLPPLPVQYADFAVWQRTWLDSGVLADGLAYWRRQLADAPERLALPADRPRPPMQTFTAGWCTHTVPAATLTALQTLGQTQHATLYMTLMTAFGVLLARCSGQRDLIVGTPIANRQDAQLEGLIGFFVNTLPLRLHVDADRSFVALLAAVRQRLLEAYRYQDVPFERLVEELAPARHLDTPPLVQVIFALQNASSVALTLPDMTVEACAGVEPTVHFDLEVHANEHDGQLSLTWLYNRDLFDAGRIEQMARHYAQLLTTVAGTPMHEVFTPVREEDR